jgi:hypothetical protein
MLQREIGSMTGKVWPTWFLCLLRRTQYKTVIT